MKKITLLFFMTIFSFCAYAQTEGFEGTFPPTGWTIHDNDIGITDSWQQSELDNPFQPPYEGDYAAFIDNTNVPNGSVAQDWLVTPAWVLPSNAQLRFFSRLTQPGNQGGVYKILVAPAGSDLSDLNSYVEAITWTEPILNPDQEAYNEKIVSIPGVVGQSYHIAFFMEGDNADRWLVDAVSLVEQCIPPTNLGVTNLTGTSADLTWTGSSAQWEVEWLLNTEAPTGSGTVIPGTPNSFEASPLVPQTAYKFYVRAVCGPGNNSEWAGPFTFQTPPINDACADAVMLTVNPTNICTSSTAGSINGATASVEPNACFGTDDDDVWFQFVATNTTHLVNLNNITGGTTDLYHVVYSGADCGALTQLYCSDPNNSVASGLTVGNTYTVRVYSWTSTAGQTSNFDICVGTPPPPPANDACVDAITVPVNADLSCAQIVTSTIYSATASPEPSTCTGTEDDDVWFEFVATGPTHTINLQNINGGTTDLVHAVYSGDDCATMTQMYCSDPNNSIATGLTPGNTYKVRVYSWTGTANQTSVFDICIGTPPPPPANDECADAVTVLTNPDLTCTNFASGTIAWATPSPQSATDCAGSEDDDVWFEFVATSTTHTVNLNNVVGSTTFLYHSIYSGTDCNALTLLNCATGTASSVGGLTIGDTYTVRVYSSTATGGQTTTFDICVGTPPPPPANDECADAVNVPVNADLNCTLVTPGTIAWATASAETNSCFGTDDDDVWYSFVATSTTHTVNLNNVTGGTTDLYHAVYSGSCGSFTSLVCSDPNNSIVGGLTIGDTYYIRVYSWTSTPGQTSTFDVCVGTPPPPPANDECDDATAVLTNVDLNCTNFESGTIAWSTPSVESSTCTGTEDDDVWFEFVATNPMHTINLNNVTGGTTDLVHVLYEGDQCGTLTQVYCSDPNNSIASGLTVGQTYKVRVYSWTATQGQTTTFDICIGTPPPPPANDECDDAIVAVVNPTQVCTDVTPGTIAWSTPSGEGNTCFGTDDDDVWFEFVATNTTHLVSLINITGSTTDLYHVVYEGDQCGTLTQLYCSDANNSFASGLTIGQTYKVRVYSWTSTQGQTSVFDLCIGTPPPPPVNDDCADATIVPVNADQFCTQTAPGIIFSATASPEGSTCTGTEDDDVWFEFVATNTTHTIELLNIVNGTTDLVHALYEGDECGTLTQLYCSDPNSSFASGLTIGQTYKVRVYSWTGTANQTSEFDICVATPPPPPANDECADATVVAVNSGVDCIEFGTGTIYSATASAEGNTCFGTDDDDVWFEFTALSETHFISLSNITGSTTDLYHVLYEGDECGTLTQLYCSDANGSLASGLTVGNVYKVRVYSWTATANQTSAFEICIGTPATPITVDETTFTTEQLVQTVLIGSPCALVTNVTSSTGTDFGQANGIGYFSSTDGSFPFSDGVVLATSSIQSAPGPNPNNNDGTNTATWLGDADLEALIAVGGNTDGTNNASVLEFDFVPLQSSFSFDFLFASDEYGTFQCSYSDAFAFILTNLDDPLAEPINMAVIPGTDLPVSVVNIRDNAYNGGCESVNPQFFGSYNPDNPNGSAIGYTGQTVPMTASATVVPGTNYHIKIVIADYRDSSFNSAVFLAGGSFDLGTVDLGVDLTVEGENAVCEGGEATIQTGLDPDAYTFVWSVTQEDPDNPGQFITTVIDGETGPDLVVASMSNGGFGTGLYTVSANYTGSTCFLEGEKTVEFYEPVNATVGDPIDLTACDASGFATFDFTSNTDLILAGIDTAEYDPADFEITYHETEEDAEDGTNPVGPVYENTTAVTQTIYVRILYTPTGCPGVKEFTLNVQDLTPQFDMGGDFNICEGTTDATITITPENFDPASPDVTISWTYEGAPLPDTGLTVTVTGEGEYAATINNSGCEATQSVFVTVTPIPVVDDMADVAACDSYTLPALSANNNYYTGPGATGEMLVEGDIITSNQEIFIYAESGTTPTNCTSESSFMVSITASPAFTISGAEIVCDPAFSTMSVEAENFDGATATYSWILDGVEVGTTQTLQAVDFGTYEVTVTVGDCSTTETFTVTENPDAVDLVLDQGCDGVMYMIHVDPLDGSFDPETSTIEWEGPNGFMSSDMDAMVEETGVYTVTVTTFEGCVGQGSVNVETVSCMVPKGISPNNDGLNDSFDLDGFNVTKLSIFNRYGQEVYSRTNYTDEWFGQTNSGDELPTGTYFYSMERSNGESKTGWVYVNRQEN